MCATSQGDNYNCVSPMRLHFDFVNAKGAVEPLTFSAPVRKIFAKTINEVMPAMRAIDDALAAGKYVAGFIAYEAAGAFDEALVTQPPGELPLVCFGVFDAPDVLDPPVHDPSHAPNVQWTSAISRDDHRRGVEAIRAAIADGETYQINYTFRLNATIDPAALAALYAALAGAEQVPYGALLDCGEWQLLSLSPELFFRADLVSGRIVTQPMKGTAARGLWKKDDDARAGALENSEKNRAENVMIVDLARNDVTRVAKMGTVEATSLFHVDRYPSVLQMVSTVEAQLRPDTPLSEIFRALFPAGSITGAPKSSSMRLITALEHAPRGAYCGAIGFAAPGGEAVFNVAIRTITARRDGRAQYGLGGGITWDSDASDEYAEALSKAACLVVRPPFELLETLRVEDGAAIRLKRHVERLANSADYFGFRIYPERIARAVNEEIQRNSVGQRRLRLRVSRDGAVTVESQDLERPLADAQPVALADVPVDRADRFLYHKTTNRSVYERHKAAHPEAFDVLLWNDAREITEFTRGNVVIEIGGRRVTPARRCGLLNGVFREELLARGEVLEAVVTVDQLASATRLWFVNSLREWVDVELRTLHLAR
jgi:para-aminobenzoate synthetase/4-amino-4-deoxychorismate lyase